MPKNIAIEEKRSLHVRAVNRYHLAKGAITGTW
jgi:hypothetical protein